MRDNTIFNLLLITKVHTQYFLFIISLIIVAFGQPAWSPLLAFFSSLFGFSLFWKALLNIPEKKKRFCIGVGWFAAVQVVQLSWMTSHPFYYIYAVLFFCAYMMGIQFGIFCLFIKQDCFKSFINLFALSGLWVIFEWVRLFFLSGMPFNPVGLSLTASIYPLQLASIGGVYLLSFIVILTNLVLLKVYLDKNLKSFFCALIISLLPWMFGFIQTIKQKNSDSTAISALLIQPYFPVEEMMEFQTAKQVLDHAIHEWHTILTLAQPHANKKIDFFVLPEYVVPFGTYLPVYPYSKIKQLLKELYGREIEALLPPLNEPYAQKFQNGWLVNNAFLAQSLANIFNTHVIVGLEDSSYTHKKRKEAFSSAFHFAPYNREQTRYEKRILVPMGEYIPFEFCRELAAQYGIQGSFSCGEKAKIFKGACLASPSICYEEGYGHLMREGRTLGAELFVNLTNDGWFPHSRLPKQHFDHARLRTVENGIPLVRACNTGVTCAVDSLGRVIDSLDQNKAGVLFVEVPKFSYHTFYSYWGDWAVILVSGFFVIAALFKLHVRS